MRSTRGWPLKLFFSLISVACVNAFVLRTLKYPNWQQKKSNRRHLYLPSVGEERVRPHRGRRADDVNDDRHTRRALAAMGVAFKQTASTTTVKRGAGRRRGRCSICTRAKDGRTDWKCYQCSEWVRKDHSVIKTFQTKCGNYQERSKYRQISFLLCSKLNSVVHKNCMYFTLHSCIRNENME
jgi:hypothetical protein